IVLPPSAEICSGPPSNPRAQKSNCSTGSNPRCVAYHEAASALSGTRMCTWSSRPMRNARASVISLTIVGLLSFMSDALPAAQTDRVAVHVGEDADPHVGRDMARGTALGRTSREQVCAGRVEILDVGVGHRSAGNVAGSQTDLEAVDVVPDVVGLVGVRRTE